MKAFGSVEIKANLKETVAHCHENNFCTFDMYFAFCVCYVEEVAGIKFEI